METVHISELMLSIRQRARSHRRKRLVSNGNQQIASAFRCLIFRQGRHLTHDHSAVVNAQGEASVAAQNIVQIGQDTIFPQDRVCHVRSGSRTSRRRVDYLMWVLPRLATAKFHRPKRVGDSNVFAGERPVSGIRILWRSA